MKALRIWAEMYEDAQKARVACKNRAERGGVDGELYAPQIAAMETAENEIGKAMRRAFRKVAPPGVIEWQKETRGVGEHLLSRLLGVIGHPIHTTPHHWEGEGENRVLVEDEPFDRRVSDLWSYCGHGDPNRKRRKGMSAAEAAALGDPRAKVFTHLLAEAAVKAGVRKSETVDDSDGYDVDGRHAISEYGKVYLERRAHTAEHRDWSDGHMHNDGLRIVGKQILKDLWLAAQPVCDPQIKPGGGPDDFRSDHPISDTPRPDVGPDNLRPGHAHAETHEHFARPDSPLPEELAQPIVESEGGSS